MAFAERYIDTPEGRTGGPGTSHDHYHPWFSRLAEEHAVVYLDHTGCGRSDRVADGTYSVSSLPGTSSTSARSSASSRSRSSGSRSARTRRSTTLAGFDVRPRLGAIEAPTLVVSGRYDRLTPPSVALEIYEALPPDHRRLHVFEWSAHRPWAEEPDAYFDVVGAFLRR